MLGSSILDVAIGMAFIYLLLSLIASTIQEALSALVQSRSANLEHGIRSLFSGGKFFDGKSGEDYLVNLIYKHGLIRGLYRDPKTDSPDTSDPDAARNAPKRKLRPFLMWLRKVLGIKPSEITMDISDPFLLPAYIPARTFAVSLIDILNPQKSNGVPLENIERTLIELCKPVEGKKPNRAAEALLALLADAKTAGDAVKAAEKFRTNIESWYNDAMDRVSGWYKKHTQGILLVIGFAIAIAFNVDTLHVARTLWFDRDARQGLVNAANTYITESPRPEAHAATGDTTANAVPAGKQTVPPPVKDDATKKDDVTKPPPVPSLGEVKDRMEKRITAFNDVSRRNLLPIGWRYTRKDYEALWRSEWNLLQMLEQLAGWLMTALALSLGAPFWFDTLNKIMVVRSTVKPQEKSLNEPSKS